MKKISWFLLFVFLLFGYIARAQTSESVIIRVSYAKKTNGLESRIMLDIGKSNTHSLYGKVKNLDASSAVQITADDDKLIVFNNEVDLMNYLFKLGYKYKSYFHSVIINVDTHNFILIKEN